MSSKEERYYSGVEIDQDPSKPLPGEVPPGRRRLFLGIGAVMVLIGFGVMLGFWLGPEPPKELQMQIDELEAELASKKAEIAELKRALSYQTVTTPGQAGALKPADRLRHEIQGRKYAKMLRTEGGGAQSAAELVEWFVSRWNQLLDRPQPDDRVGRRAELLTFLVSGMARNLNPGDFTVWQGEFFRDHKWLGELHMDLDGDGFPGKRADKNPRDGFAAVSVCQIAMALNQSAADALILILPELKCDQPENKMSVFLNGRTLDDAFDEFVRAVKRERFIVKENAHKGTRLIWIGPKR